MRENKIIDSIQKIRRLSNDILFEPEEIDNRDLERYFFKFEKIRRDMYNQVEGKNTFLDFLDKEKIETINDEYYAELKKKVLKIHIPESVPSIKQGKNYIQNQIIYNVSRVTKQYEKLFYNKPVTIIIQLYDDKKSWDADNRNVKPIIDGLVYGKVIVDDSIHYCSYMVQGFYSDEPYIDVYVIGTEKILNPIYRKLERKYDKIFSKNER